MVNEIVDGISVALSDAFDGVTIYSESVAQGLQEPCFFILNLTAEEVRLLGNRAQRNMAFDIHYFPKSKVAPKAECQSVASGLYPVLRQITLLDGSNLLGLNLNHDIIDGVLYFNVEFKPTIQYVNTNPVEEMQTVEVNQSVKGD